MLGYKMNKTEERKNCRKNRQCLKFFLFSLCLTSITFKSAADLIYPKRNYTPHKQIQVQVNEISRAPASFVPNDELAPLPFSPEPWVNELVVKDSSGILEDVKNQIAEWQEREEYVRLWNLESTGLYHIPESGSQTNYISKNFFKYMDKRISGEIKSAEEGSTMHTVGQVQQALRPQTKVQVSENIKLRFKVRVLQGRLIANVENPYVDYNANFSLSGKGEMYLGKRFEEIGLNAKMQYIVHEGRWIASVDKKLTETIHAGASSTQEDNGMAFTGDASDQIFGLYFNKPF